MPSITKSSGKYFEELARVWQETMWAGVLVFWVGVWRGRMSLPSHPTPDSLRMLFSGTLIQHKQANRVNCYDITFTLPKSLSIYYFGLQTPDRWQKGIDRLIRHSKPEVEVLLSNQIVKTGAQGRTRIPSQGIGAAYFHYLSSFKSVHGHIHYAVPNASVTKQGVCSSIGNAHEMFRTQGEMRARFLKQHDQDLQADGIRTVRVGNHFEIAQIPNELIKELSPGSRIMDELRTAKGFSSARANDFYARDARDRAHTHELKTPSQIVQETTAIAKKHGVTFESIQHSPEVARLINDPFTRNLEAYQIAKEALRACENRYGTFTESQYRERLYTLSQARPTRIEELDRMALHVLKERSFAGVTRLTSKNRKETRFRTEKSSTHQQEQSTKANRTPQHSWDDLKRSVKGLRDVVIVKTLDKAKRIVDRISEYIDPPVKLRIVDGKNLDSFLKPHLPMSRLKSHAIAIISGMLRPGNPHERAFVAERIYQRLRQHHKLPRNSVLIVKNSDWMSLKEHSQLQKIARRDRASVVFSDARNARGKRPFNPNHHNKQTER